MPPVRPGRMMARKTSYREICLHALGYFGRGLFIFGFYIAGFVDGTWRWRRIGFHIGQGRVFLGRFAIPLRHPFAAGLLLLRPDARRGGS